MIQQYQPTMPSPLWILSAFALLLSACSPGRSIVGYVTDVDGGPVVNAEMVLVETGDIASSGADGRFELTVPSNTESHTLRVDGWSSAGGPYSFTPIYINDESWNLSPGGQAKAQVLRDGKVQLGVMAILKKLDRASSIPENLATSRRTFWSVIWPCCPNAAISR